MPYTSSTTPEELRQMIDNLAGRAEAALPQYLELESLYRQAIADKAQVEELLAQNNIPLPKPVPAHQVNNMATGGVTINNINNFYINPNPWDAINDVKVSGKSTDPKDAKASGSGIKVTTPPMPLYRDTCTRGRCNRGFCKMVYPDQIKHYGDEAIKDLPWKTGDKKT